MKRLQYALLTGSALVALTVAGCSSNTSKPAAQQPPASTSTTAAASGTPSTTGTTAPSTGGTATSGAPAGSGKSSSPASKPSGKASSAPAGTPADCDNAKLNASLAPRTSTQKASVHVIAVKNTGAACTLQYLPYVWITAGPGGGPEQTRPLIPSGLGGGPNILAAGATQYAAIDLNPGNASNAVDGYTYLAVTANPTPNTSGKDVQDLKLPAPAKVAKAKLGMYLASPAEAISSAEGADTPEQ
ncbi:hypothetical protein [Catenulispora subtropica]|uniref:DUF4232 domain-containing protein n=1 Tax=Catenulispora subtropica TaxID=450798 RepID=A0ABP5EFX8_9ACTN